MDQEFIDEIDRDFAENGPGQSPYIRLTKLEQYARELTATNRRLEAELAEARKDGERLSALQGGRLSTQYRDGATPSMDKWIVTFCATPIAGGSTLREAIDNATAARGTR